MEQFILNILNYLLDVLLATLSQIFVLLGPLLLLAFLMNFIAKLNENLSYKVLGRSGYLYVFGWLGTAVHELGHAIFAILFGHKITELVLFSPNAESGSLGHVSHSYNSTSIYQNIGNFFIGIGPIILGSLVLYIITYYLFGFSIATINNSEFSSESLLSLASFKATAVNMWGSILIYLEYIFTGQNTSWWKILLLFYLLYSIGSSITLSSADVEGALGGFIFFIVLLFLFNLITLWIGDFTVAFFLTVSNFFSGLYFLIILSMFINLLFIIILFIITLIKSLTRH